MESEEKWRWVPGYEGRYMVSDLGRVFGVPAKNHFGHVMKLFKTKTGYVHVCLCKDNEKRNYSVHRLVAAAFVDNKENKQEVNHINGIRFDNRASNLEWCTRSENEKHAYRVLGKKPNAPWRDKPRKFARKFNDDQIRLIRSDNRPRTAIAKEYGVTKQTIEHIQKRLIYKEVI